MGKRIGPRSITLAIVVWFLVLAMGCATTPPRGLPEVERVVVPDVVGRPLGEATEILLGRHLAIEIVGVRSSDPSLDIVSEQTPVAGTMVETRREMPFVVKVAIAPPAVANGHTAVAPAVMVPRLSGHTVQEIEKQLRPLGLRLGQVTTRATGQAQPGTVIDQNPKSGARVESGTAVNVVIATTAPSPPPAPPPPPSPPPPSVGLAPPPAPVVVPTLSGRTVEEIQTLLARAGLRLGQVTSEVSDRPAGTIIDQDPKPDAAVASGTAVDVVIAKTAPPPPPSVGLAPPPAPTPPPPVPPAVGSSGQDTTLGALKWKLLSVGLGLIVLILAVAVLIPHPTSFQYIVFRTTLALAAACVASALPGFFEFKRELPQAGIAAGGALAVFVLVYMLDPGRIKGKIDDDSGPTSKP